MAGGFLGGGMEDLFEVGVVKAVGDAVRAKQKTVAVMMDEMMLTIARDLTPLRPGRTEPRVKKRRPKNHRLMTSPRKEIGPLPHRKVGVENRLKTSRPAM